MVRSSDKANGKSSMSNNVESDIYLCQVMECLVGRLQSDIIGSRGHQIK